MVGSRCVVRSCSNRRMAFVCEFNICGSGLLKSKGIIYFHSHRLNLWSTRCTSRKIILIELSIRHSVGNLNPILCPAYGEERRHLQKGIQRDKVVWRRRSGKSLGSCGFFLCYTFALSCTRCLLFYYRQFKVYTICNNKIQMYLVNPKDQKSAW